LVRPTIHRTNFKMERRVSFEIGIRIGDSSL
jgi:hypothetical protein